MNSEHGPLEALDPAQLRCRLGRVALADCPATIVVSRPLLSPPTDAGAMVAVGKGLDEGQARRSCLGELIETLSITATGAEDEWLEARRLDGRRGWVPARECYLAAAPRAGGDRVAATSTGCAAGKDLPSAVLAGFLELVEREALREWACGRRQAAPLALGEAPPTALGELVRWFQSRARRFAVLEVGGELDVAVFAALAMDDDLGRLCVGSSAHPEPARALEAAMLELVQMELAMRMGRCESSPWSPGEVTAPEAPARLARRLRSHLQAPASARSSGQLFEHPRRDSEDLLTQCRRELDAENDAIWSVDLTRPSLGVPVVRVLTKSLCRRDWRPHPVRTAPREEGTACAR